jgi:iron(III) transport system permease protein
MNIPGSPQRHREHGGSQKEAATSLRKAKPKRTSLFSAGLILAIITALVLLYGVIYPNLSVFITSLQRDGVWTFANYREALSQRVVLEAIVNSVGISLATVGLCGAIGIPLAFLFETYTFPGRRFFAVLAALPLVLPPLVGTVALFSLG